MVGFNLGFVGAGQMARAIGISLVQKGILKPTQVTVSSPEEPHLEVWRKRGCNTTPHNGEVVDSSDLIMWAVKPQFFQSALKETEVKGDGHDKKLHVSVMAGVPLLKFSEMVGSHFKVEPIKAARVMPNIAMQVQAGVSVYTMGKNCDEDDTQNLTDLLSALGLCYQVNESQINAYCGLFASGIGFMFPILEAMADGGVKMGIPRELSVQISAQTMKGAAEILLKNHSAHPGQLKDSVCSPGGTTIEGVSILEQFGVRNALIQAIQASTRRGEELDKSHKSNNNKS